MVETMEQTESFKLVAETLRKVMKMYRKAIEMNLEDQERLILKFFRFKGEKHEELAPVKEACDTVLAKWTTGLPHDSTLIDEVAKLLPYPFKTLLPQDSFDRDMWVYKFIDLEIESLFQPLNVLDLGKSHRHIIEKLQRLSHNTLIDNPNFKGDSPYYKRHYMEYDRAKRLWLELNDQDFNSYIEYFEEE